MWKSVIAAIAIGLPATVAAHSFWLEPLQHDPQAGEDVTVAFRVGDAGEATDWGLYWERIASLRVYGPNGVIDQQGAVRTTVLGFESNPSFSDLEAERFNNYVEHEGLVAIAAHREANGTTDENGTELYARRAKALFQVGAEHTDNITQPVGHLLEIVPLESPFALQEGDTLPVQILWRGAPLEGANIAVVRPFADNETEIVKTDANGRASFELKHGSRYLLSVVWGVPAPNDARADYFTIFASLTFPSPDLAFGANIRPPDFRE